MDTVISGLYASEPEPPALSTRYEELFAAWRSAR